MKLDQEPRRFSVAIRQWVLVRTIYLPRQSAADVSWVTAESVLEVGRILKIRNRVSRFLLPIREIRNW